MAKSKKAETTAAEGSAAPKKKAAAPKKKAAPAPAAAPQQPLIDTHLAAETAAKLIANRDVLAAAPSGEKTEGEKPQTSTFKQLKENLAHPHLKSLDSLLGTMAGQKKGGLTFNTKQVGQNQTFGADVNRHNIPRRTSSGG